MLEERKRELPGPGKLVAKSIAVEDPDVAQTVEDAQVENLAGNDQRPPNRNPPGASINRPKRSVSIAITPTEKHGKLNCFEAIEEFLQNRDRRSKTRNQGTAAERAKGLRMAPNEYVADALEAERGSRNKKD